jgi:hypothetical protein
MLAQLGLAVIFAASIWVNIRPVQVSSKLSTAMPAQKL